MWGVERWKKKFCDSIVHSNYKLAACVHCTRYTLCRRISSSIDRSVTFIQEIFKQWKSWDSLENCRVLYENALCSTQCVLCIVCHGWLQNYLEPTKVNERSSIFFPRALNFQRNRILMTSCDFPWLLNNFWFISTTL